MPAVDTPPPDIAVLITCFNRADTTIGCLKALRYAAQGHASYAVFLVDDASKDDTVARVRAEFPDVKIIKGTGNLYWNMGMRLAWTHAQHINPRFFLWLNDDAHLFQDAIARMLAAYNAAAKTRGDRVIIVGRTISENGTTTYGGYRRVRGVSRLKFRHLQQGEVECDTMNGNCVLIPEEAAIGVGLNSPYYSHSGGDLDYGLRARAAGYTILEEEKPVAVLERNEAYGRSMERLSLRNAKFIFFHPKGIPVKEWLYFCVSHGGIMWPVNFVVRYLRILRFGLD